MNSLKLYAWLERLPTRHSYPAKLMGVTICGALIQWLMLGLWLVTGNVSRTPSASFLLVLAVGLIVTALTLWAIWNLVWPVCMVASFLDKYAKSGEISDLPAEYEDEIGTIMRHTKNTVVSLDRSRREVEHASQIDALTGLLNRRASSEKLQHDLARADRSQVPVSTVVFDIDKFKELNEHYGTKVGDVCLQHFANIAAASIRDGDWIGRWGGDEYIVVLWGADSEIAEAVIWRIKRNIAASELALEAGIKLTASYGYSTHMPGQLNHEFIAKADSALLQAKKQGRNHVCGAPAR
ncbi:MAG: GGDEF domain-containing protein [Fimbriimonas sp.]|nr:GGDEF domain-containing protein [Fimbriimonas sp.]